MGQYQNIKIDDFKEPAARSHLYRYYCARGWIEPEDIVVDAACGAGYGTELLSKYATKVIGLDRDIDAIKYATINHKKDNNYFMVSNLDQMNKFPDCDVAITIETIEHLRYPGSFATKMKDSVRRRIFLTTPIVPTKHEDSTHLQDFNEGAILEMFVDEHWGCIDSSVQGVYLMIAFYRR